MQSNRAFRYAFLTAWFFVAPLALAAVTVRLLSPAEHAAATSLFGQIQYWVDDQPVPSLIVLFTVYEMILYYFRYSLPLADKLGVGGRTDVPAELRREYEQAGHLIEEAERLRRRKRKQFERAAPASAREDLSDALESLKEAMRREPFDEDEFDRAHDRARTLVERHLGRWRKSEIREYAESIGIAVAVALLLRAFVVEAFKIPSGSMLPTLQIQDHIFVNKFKYGPTVPFTKIRLFTSMPPERGDVIVFETPDPAPHNEGQDFIKRVIAIPGDTLVVEDGHPIINGWKVPRCDVGDYEFRESVSYASTSRGELFVEYLGEHTYLTLFEADRFGSSGRQGPYHVKPGEVWVLGDNRNNSSDSRAWFHHRGGGAPFGSIKGRAMFVWLAFGFDGSVHWDRLLLDVMGKPKLPKGAPPSLVAKIEACIEKRSTLKTTDPPPPRG